MEAAPNPDGFLNECKLIVAFTSAREPVLETWGRSRGKERRARHITRIGADATEKIPLRLLSSASSSTASSSSSIAGTRCNLGHAALHNRMHLRCGFSLAGVNLALNLVTEIISLLNTNKFYLQPL